MHFLSSSYPSALMVHGSVCDQLLFDNKLHPAHRKHAPFRSKHLPFGFRSHHVIDLGTTNSIIPPTEPIPEPAHQQQSQPTRRVLAASTKSKQILLQKAVEKAKKREGQSQQGTLHGKPPVANHVVTFRGRKSDALSISTFNDSNSKIASSGSPKFQSKPQLLLTNKTNDGFVIVSNGKKRTCSRIDFSTLW